MRWTLAGCCGLVLVSLSVAVQVEQIPRFYGLKRGSSVPIYCRLMRDKTPNITVQWFKAHKYNDPYGERQEIKKDDRIKLVANRAMKNAILYFVEVQTEDTGVYFCKIKQAWGPGTAVQVVRSVNPSQSQYRSQMKDGLIVLQGLLIAGCVAAVLLRKRTLTSDTKDTEYEEPETDHIYEGLAIETCGGGLYEDLTAYIQTEGAEAPWE